ncbi:ABC transporter substrate-binding protein [Acaryochloris marina]|uniref:Probable iron(III) dicitrate ABC transporter n=1 Tax=Acaryochloris marina (strain MBIC 11017) TaxID=329726 RepID=B0C039_ACAM1|nr:iron-siderophore ABC transporter substrate-binding protein [Acaryochloris marina]ABW28386.1 probable iron(III) dicitrate ABC transporter [Acaryochloris marina MBIC11017]
MSLFKLLLLVMLSGSLLACQRTEPSKNSPSSAEFGSCRTITHEQGKTEICRQPQRIVVLGPYLLEQVLALGAQPVGYADHLTLHQGDYKKPSEQIPYLGNRVKTQPVNVGLAYQPSVEAILKAQPDLILAPDLATNQYQALTQIAPTLSFKIEGGKTNLQAIAQALDRRDRAQQLVAQNKQQLQAAQTTFQPVVADHPKVLALSSADAQSFTLISHTNSFCGSFLKDLGFQLVYPKGLKPQDLEASQHPTLSIETLPQLNAANSIILFGYDFNPKDSGTEFSNQQLQPIKQAWQQNAIAQSLKASKSGRVYFVPAYLCLGLPGPIGTELYLNELKQQLLTPQTRKHVEAQKS